MIPFANRHLRRLIAEYVAHYHRGRHQVLVNELIGPPPQVQKLSAAFVDAKDSVAAQLFWSRDVTRRRDDGSADE